MDVYPGLGLGTKWTQLSSRTFYFFIKYLKRKEQLILSGGSLFSCTFSYFSVFSVILKSFHAHCRKFRKQSIEAANDCSDTITIAILSYQDVCLKSYWQFYKGFLKLNVLYCPLSSFRDMAFSGYKIVHLLHILQFIWSFLYNWVYFQLFCLYK